MNQSAAMALYRERLPKPAAKRIEVVLKQRDWQRPLISWYRAGGRHGIVVAHRRAGKDRASLFIELEKMNDQHGCEVWHSLPEQEHARKVIWDGRTKTGERLIDVAFPLAIRKRTVDNEMKIELKTGSLWRLVGADRIDALVGGNPRHVTFSEFALTNPRARQLIRPILAENGGTELMITTPRGYNHAYEAYEYAKTSPLWYAGLHPVSETHLIDEETLAEEHRTMPDELYRQEYECDFSAANLGAILGRYVEAAEREGRLNCAGLYDDARPVMVASDIGFRDSSSWWFWQPVYGGWNLIENLTASGWDAGDWCVALGKLPYKLDKIYLPQDSKAKTFATKRSALETFLEHFGSGVVKVLPPMRVEDRINAARVVMRQCRFAPECKDGLLGLREWSYDYNEDTRAFSKEPRHDWASHPGDGYSYFATVAEVQAVAPPPPSPFSYNQPAHHAWTLEQLYEDRDRMRGGRHF